jgi:hypothetical protein
VLATRGVESARNLSWFVQSKGKAVSNDHVDAEELAAWSAGVLSPRQASTVELHVADCHECQSMVAAFARTEPIAPAKTPWWQRGQIRWLVPLATAATLAAIYVALPQRVMSPTAGITEPERNTPAMAPAPQTAPREAPGSPATPSDAAVNLRDATRERSAATPPARTPAVAVARPKSEATAGAAGAVPAPLASRPVTTGAAPAAAPAAVGAPPAMAPQLPATFAPAKPAPPPPAPETRAEAETALRAAAAAAPRAAQQRAAVEFAAPDGTARWRIAGTRLERSTDGGAVWRALDLVTRAPLLAGHAASADIVWVVGSGGTIYAANDGVTFNAVPFNEAVDLVAVVALDARSGRVTTADGRVYSTADGGKTWVAAK